MNTSRIYSLITDQDESLSAFEAFRTAFAADAQFFPMHSLGWQGGSVSADVHWHRSLRIWGVFERSPLDEHINAPRFWICFGVADPNDESMLKITVEMNPPHQGENRRIGGVFLRDEESRIYVGHSGKVGGGRPGIGQRAFKSFSQQLDWREIETPKGLREVVVFGPLQAGRLSNALAPFIHTVADFKESVTIHR